MPRNEKAEGTPLRRKWLTVNEETAYCAIVMLTLELWLYYFNYKPDN
jgi:hypothetical protein